jgi:cytochrome c oxidase assembly protein subunit 15
MPAMARSPAGHPAVERSQMPAFRRFSLLVLAYNLAVILWGAYVRASGAGAGCGSHWPLCNGEAVPQAPSTATLIEYSHRVSSGLVLVLAVSLVVWAFRGSSRGHPVRRPALAVLGLTLSEAALGAGLVLFKLVARDESLTRALTVGAHLLNTLLLLAALALTVRAAGERPVAFGQRPVDRPPRLALLLGLALAAVLLLGATGAVAALGDTLFPSRSLAQGLAQDFSAATPFLIRLRVLHPFLALVVGLGLLAVCQQARALPEARRWAIRLRFLVLGQWGVGLLDLGLLAPLWLQMVHLLMADLTWLALVLLAAEALDPLPSGALAASSASLAGSPGTLAGGSAISLP